MVGLDYFRSLSKQSIFWVSGKFSSNTYGSIKNREVNWGSHNHNNDSGNGDDYGGGVYGVYDDYASMSPMTTMKRTTTRTMKTNRTMKKMSANDVTFYTIGYQKLL